MLANLIREFCKESKNNYEVYENYSKRTTTPLGETTVTTIGIVVKEGGSYMDMLAQLTSYLEEKGFDDPLMELEGTGADALGPDTIVYFPAIQDDQPLQP